MPPKRLPSRFVVLGLFAISALLISLLYSIIDSTRRSPGSQPVTPTTPPATLPVINATQQPSLLSANDPPRATPVATAPMLRLADDYHLLLYGVGQEGNFPPARLHHAVNGEIETLPYHYPYSSGFLKGENGKTWL